LVNRKLSDDLSDTNGYKSTYLFAFTFLTLDG
jgi:hypothetical protein